MNRLNYTVETNKLQELAENWYKNIGKHLPENLNETAKEHGAMLRKRGVQEAFELLKIFLIFATSNISIRMLALAANALNISTISDTAWHKKIKSSVPWLTFILNSMLHNAIAPQDNIFSKKKKVFLIDGSCFRQEGKSQNIYRLHMNYCLTTACMHEIKVTDNHVAESLSHHTIEENAIYMADAGYGKASNYGYVVSKKAHAIFRITPNHTRLFDSDNKKIDIALLLKTDKPSIEINCFIKYEKNLIPIRIIASRLPEDKIEEAVKRKKRKSQKNQNKIKPETLVYAQWVIIATSLDDSYSKEEILSIYRSRWQIELLFKRIKQSLKVQTIRPASEAYVLALIHLWLIVWALTERQMFEFEKLLIQKNIDLKLVSAWSFCSLFFNRIVSIIESTWTLLVDPLNIELLTKYLLNHKSSRKNQYFDYHLCNLLEINA